MIARKGEFGAPMANDGLIRPHQSRLQLLQRLFDAVVIGGSVAALMSLRGSVWEPAYTNVVLIAVLGFVLVAEFTNLYQSWRGTTLRAEMGRVWTAWAWVAASLLVLSFATKTSADFSRLVMLSWMLVCPSLLCIYRSIIRMILRRMRDDGRNSRSAAIIGTGKSAARMARVIHENPWYGIVLRGFYNDGSSLGFQPDENLPISVCGDLNELVAAACAGQIDQVYIALPLTEQVLIGELLNRLQDSTASVYLVPDIGMFDLMQARMVDLGGVPILSLRETPFLGIDGWVKRGEDIVLGTLILILISVPMLLIGAAVRLTSKGPALFKQRRYGLNGKEIWVWKFRSMSVMENSGAIRQATKGDVRITPLGAFLRRTSLDELPQFINVLTGQMSIVGPRPHAVAHNEEYRKLIADYMLRHKVKPGITGWAQVNGWRGETDTLEKMEKRIEFDLYYIRNWALFLDLKIILMTVFKGFGGKNAY
jgi:putative colanic acid biosysnthesis UDP-glucose lipid carrier transferase